MTRAPSDMAAEKHKPLVPPVINPLHQLKVMGRFVRRRTKKPGSPPGTLVHSGPVKMEKTQIRFFDYDAGSLSEASPDHVEDCFALKDLPTVSWINVDGLHDIDLIQKVGGHFGWHPLLMEDIVSVGQHAKYEDHGDHLFVVLPMLSWSEATGQVTEEQLSMIVGDNYVFTFQEVVGDTFEGVRDRLRAGRPGLRTGGPDYLAYALIDATVDHYFKVLEGIGDRTERLDDEVINNPTQEAMHALHALKRELIVVRRAIRPVRDVMNGLHRDETGILSDQVGVFLRDVYDHAVQVMDTVEALRDVVNGLVDLYMSTVSFKTNEVMKVLTIMASIFIPLTFLAGIYGMNFENMPELSVRWAYPTLLVAMAVTGLGMVAYFRHRRWF